VWTKIKQTKNAERWNPEQEEEFEDSAGNVVTKKTFEDLQRQGLLWPPPVMQITDLLAVVVQCFPKKAPCKSHVYSAVVFEGERRNASIFCAIFWSWKTINPFAFLIFCISHVIWRTFVWRRFENTSSCNNRRNASIDSESTLMVSV